jgi:hypothetical protein
MSVFFGFFVYFSHIRLVEYDHWEQLESIQLYGMYVWYVYFSHITRKYPPIQMQETETDSLCLQWCISAHSAPGSVMSSYERLREANIRKNREVLAGLGLDTSKELARAESAVCAASSGAHSRCAACFAFACQPCLSAFSACLPTTLVRIFGLLVNHVCSHFHHCWGTHTLALSPHPILFLVVQSAIREKASTDTTLPSFQADSATRTIVSRGRRNGWEGR